VLRMAALEKLRGLRDERESWERGRLLICATA
jgi:hypothetical protein